MDPLDALLLHEQRMHPYVHPETMTVQEQPVNVTFQNCRIIDIADVTGIGPEALGVAPRETATAVVMRQHELEREFGRRMDEAHRRMQERLEAEMVRAFVSPPLVTSPDSIGPSGKSLFSRLLGRGK